MSGFRWTVQIEGEQQHLKHLPGLLTGPSFQIEAVADGGVFLRSAAFESCVSPAEVVDAATHVLRRLGSLLQIYAGVPGQFTVRDVFWLDESSHLRQHIQRSVLIRVISEQGVKQLATTRTASSATLGSDLLELAANDDGVARALDLLSGKDISWYELYDIIDVM